MLSSGGTPAFPAALQEHRAVLSRDLLPTPAWKWLEMELEAAFTGLNLFLSLLNSWKTSLQARLGCSKCFTRNHGKNELHSTQQRCFHSIWCLSSPKFSLGASLCPYNWFRHPDLRAWNTCQFSSVTIWSPVEGKNKNNYNPRNCKGVTHRSIPPITNNPSPHALKLSSKRLKAFKDVKQKVQPSRMVSLVYSQLV